MSSTDPLARRTTTVYDLASRSIATINPLAQRTTSVYDAASRQVGTIDALGYRITYGYDAAGRRIQMTDANNHRVTMLVDALGQDLGSIDPLSRRVTFAYDPVGNRTRKLDPRGNLVTTVYDGLKRMTLQSYSTGKRVSYLYDPAGNRTRMADPTGVYSTVYDARSRTASVTSPGPKRVTYTNDAADRRTRLTDPDGGRFTYSYDLKDRLTAVTNPQGKRTSLAYDPVDRQVRQVHGNGGITTSIYDAAGQLGAQSNTTSAAAVINRFTYSYDGNSRRVGVRESSGDRTTWSYDNAGQLQREFRTGLTAFCVTYTYDGPGNRLAQTDSGTRTTYLYDAANQLLTETNASTGRTTYSYDNSGNRTQKNAFAGLTLYQWDEDSRLHAATPVANPVTLAYNGDGQRVQKLTAAATVHFVYDFEKVLQESNAGGSTTREYTETVEQYGNLLSAYDGSATSYYDSDGLGSTDALLNDAQTATDRYAYRAFGLATQTAGTTVQPFTFVGKQGYYSDPETDLYLAGARYYDFAAGRWLNEDPLGYKAGDINLYRYAKNDPVNKTDPSGLCSPPYATLEDCGLLDLACHRRNLGRIAWNVLVAGVNAAVAILPGVDVGQFWCYVEMLNAVLGTIIRSAGSFFSNLIAAFSQGFTLYANNIGMYLQAAALQWLLGPAATSANVTLPAAFDFSSAIWFVLQLLNLTWDSILNRLIAALATRAGVAPSVIQAGIQTVYNAIAILQQVSMITDPSQAIMTLLGWADTIVTNLTPQTIFNSLIGAIPGILTNVLIQTVIPAVITSITPMGAALNALLGIYRTLVWVFTNFSQLQALATTFIRNIRDIAAGGQSAINTVAGRVAASLGTATATALQILGALSAHEQELLIRRFGDGVIFT